MKNDNQVSNESISTLNEYERNLATLQNETIQSLMRLISDMEHLQELHNKSYDLAVERYSTLPRFSEERMLIDSMSLYLSHLDSTVEGVKKDAPDLLEQIKCIERNKNQ